MKYRIPKTRIHFVVDGFGNYTYFPQYRGFLEWKNIIYSHDLSLFVKNPKPYGYKNFNDARDYIDLFIKKIQYENTDNLILFEDNIEYPESKK
jgi:hypothetical protein